MKEFKKKLPFGVLRIKSMATSKIAMLLILK